MDQTDTRFDWISWFASIPGIPADWGNTARYARAKRPEDRLPLAA
jgi:hypothetical protein